MAVECPLNPRWVASMLAVLPVGSQGKLARFGACPEVKDLLAEKKEEKEAEAAEKG